MVLFVVLLISYIVGSIPFASVVARFLNTQNPLAHGSKNPGTTNMVRIAGKTAGILTFLGDSLKGFIMIELLTFFSFLYHDNAEMTQAISCISAIFVVLGHIYSVFLKFRGGKGVATTIGVIFALNFMLGLLSTCTWVIVFALFRISGLAAIVSAIALPCYAYYLYHDNMIFGVSLILAVMVLFRHKSNIIGIFKKV